MTNAASFEGIRYVRSDLYNTTSLTPLRETHHKGGVFGAILGVVAAIVVPFIAPVIAGSLFGAGTVLGSAVPMLAGAASGTASALGTALTGAALGAGTSALTGGNVLTGALLGGAGAGANALFGGAPLLGSADATAAAAAATPTLGATTAIPGTEFATLSAPTVADTAGTLSTTTAAAAPAAAPGIAQTLSNATGNFVSADTVGKLGQAALGAGIQAIPSMLAADEAAAAGAAQADLARAQADVFKNQLSIAEDLKQSALNVDPNYMAQRATSGVFKNLAAQQREVLGAEAIRGGESQAAFDAGETRRGQIYGTEAAITAGENARLAGLSTQGQMLRQASAAYPTPPSGYANYLERAASGAAKGYGQMLGGAAYPFLQDYMKSFYNSQYGKTPSAVG